MKFASIGEQDSSIDAGDQDWLAFLDKHFIPFFSSHSLCQIFAVVFVSFTHKKRQAARARTNW